MRFKSHFPKKGLLVLNIGILLLLWGDLFNLLATEWVVNEQYRFGFLVPFIAGYLIFLRWENRPPVQSHGFRPLALLFLTLAVAFIYPLRIVFEANPDWRLVYWLQTLTVFAATMAVFWHWGGLSWVKHFALPFALLFFAVPWPTRLEQPLILDLMQTVAGITVEVLNLLGIHALQRGNLIQLANILVGVEEACSGVRSFQSTLMSAYFVGELFRFPGWLRLILILFGSFASILLNVGRTFLLTYVTYREGSARMAEIHDPIGYFVSFLAFLILIAVSWLLLKSLRLPKGREMEKRRGPGPNWIGLREGISLLLFFLLSFPAAEAWYRRNPETVSHPLIAAIDWDRIDAPVQFEKIAGPVRAVLRYSEGTKASWTDPEREKWIVYYLVWKPGDVSSFIDVHRPELCLAGAGFNLLGRERPLSWRENGLQLQLTPYTFEFQKKPVFVFFAVWNDNQEESILATVRTAGDRLRSAYRGERIKGRRSLEIAIVGPETMDQAREKALAFLERTLVVTRY